MLHLVRQKSYRRSSSLYYSQNSGEVKSACLLLYQFSAMIARSTPKLLYFFLERYIDISLCSSSIANFSKKHNNNKPFETIAKVFLGMRQDRDREHLIYYRNLKCKMELLRQRKAFSPFCYCMTIDINVLLCNKFPPKLLFEIINRF